VKIFLIGFMGSGKSHTGKSLAQLLNVDFIDLDARIEANTGRSISDIFEVSGEDTFRQLEQDQLKSLSDIADAVVATGGGTPCFFDNMQWMNENGVTVYLKADEALLADRLKNEKEQRPLIKNLSNQDLLDFIREKLGERATDYEQARIIFEQDQRQETTSMALLKQITHQLRFDGPGKLI